MRLASSPAIYKKKFYDGSVIEATDENGRTRFELLITNVVNIQAIIKYCRTLLHFSCMYGFDVIKF